MSWLSAALGVASGIFSAKASQSSADKQMAFQKEMYQNRHQYEVEDLRKAGLNPVLSAGASPPTVSGASANTGGDINQGVSNAITAYSAKQQAKLVQKQTDVMDSEIQKNQSEANRNNADADWLSGQNTRANELQPFQKEMMAASAAEKKQAVEVAKQTVEKMRADVANSTKIADSQAQANLATAWRMYRAGELDSARLSEVAAHAVESYAHAGLYTQQQATEVKRALALSAQTESMNWTNERRNYDYSDPVYSGSKHFGDILDAIVPNLLGK